MRNKIQTKFRKKIKKAIQEKLKRDGLKKTCPLCDKTFVIMPTNVIYTVGGEPTHFNCFMKFVQENKNV